MTDIEFLKADLLALRQESITRHEYNALSDRIAKVEQLANNIAVLEAAIEAMKTPALPDQKTVIDSPIILMKADPIAPSELKDATGVALSEDPLHK